MNINTNLSNFIKKHRNKSNQVIFHKADCKKNNIIQNIINNFLTRKNSFIFESVEKRRIRGRYTIIGADPDKIWDFNKNGSLCGRSRGGWGPYRKSWSCRLW